MISLIDKLSKIIIRELIKRSASFTASCHFTDIEFKYFVQDRFYYNFNIYNDPIEDCVTRIGVRIDDDYGNKINIWFNYKNTYLFANYYHFNISDPKCLPFIVKHLDIYPENSLVVCLGDSWDLGI